jgi:hypothetical protein
MSSGDTRPGARPTITPWVILALVVVVGVVGYYILTQPGAPSGTASGSSLNNAPAAQVVLDELDDVSTATLNRVGPSAPNVTSPTALNSSTPLTLDGKPEVLYIGAEYCPYCAAERWAMIVALDKFGSFTGIQYMQSSSTDVYPNTDTFTFQDATYASGYISFVSVEQLDRNSQPLQTATPEETSLMSTYDSGQAIPFIDYANEYAQVGSQYSPSVLVNASWTQIAAQLDNASSAYAQNIDGAANRIISAICKIDGGLPSSVCSQPLATALSYIVGPFSSGLQLPVSEAALRGEPSSARAVWPAPSRLTDRV